MEYLEGLYIYEGIDQSGLARVKGGLIVYRSRNFGSNWI